jgi:hypothetical protein
MNYQFHFPKWKNLKLRKSINIIMNDNIKSYLTEAHEGYSKSLVQVDEFLETQETQLNEAKAHRENMVSKIAELAEMLGIDETAEVAEMVASNDTLEVAETEPEVAPV